MLIRADLTLPQQMVQAAHAAHEAGIYLAKSKEDVSYLVLCTVPDEEALRKAQYKLEARGIRTSLFIEPDLGDQATALASEPVSGRDRRPFSRYPLWRE